jgi:adenine-specific DNA-methyltransferase
MDGYSVNIKQDQIEKLKELFPEAVTEGKVDWEKLKATLGEDVNFANERYVLNWAGKSDAFKVLDIQTSATLKPLPEESINFDTTQNVFIEGENLEVLKVLRKSYYGKIKRIIIDPPYNTGSDSFIYPDSFKEARSDYERRIGDKDEEGFLMKEGLFRKNSKDTGHFHSNWLSMMYPRLMFARNLLHEEGIILVHIDDNEMHNLRMLMNEIFGEENFIEEIIWKNKYNAGALSKGFSNVHEYILVYSKTALKNIEAPLTDKQIKAYKLKDEKFNIRGPYVTQPLATASKDERPNLVFPILYKDQEIWPEKQWIWSKERVEQAFINNEIVFNEDEDGEVGVRVKQYLKDENGKIRNGKPLSIFEGPFNQEGNKDIKKLFGKKGYFSFPKPVDLVKQLLSIIINGDESNDYIILDFFGGSGTTAQAVLEMNQKDKGKRKFILVQLPEPTEEKSMVYKEGYKTIAEISKERIRKTINKLIKEQHENKDLFSKPEHDLGFKVFKLTTSNFKIWRGGEVTEQDLVQQLDAFVNPIKDQYAETDMLYELLVKAGYLLTDKIEKKDHYYAINEGEMIIALKEMNKDVVEAMLAAKPKKVLTLDNLFAGNDQLKTNTVLQMRDAGIDFKTI